MQLWKQPVKGSGDWFSGLVAIESAGASGSWNGDSKVDHFDLISFQEIIAIPLGKFEFKAPRNVLISPTSQVGSTIPPPTS